MSITVGDNFSYQGGKPLDARFQFSSVANMKAFAEASLYDGCLAYIPSLKKYYTYDSSNTVDTTTGRWRELETGGGGGGTSDYTDLTNKPQIAGVTLTGNKALATFGLTDQVETQSTLSIDRNTKSYVNRGEKYDWNTASTWYGTCSTSESTTAKSVTLARGTLNFVAGAKIAIKFTYTNTASAPTLTINSTTKNIKYIDADGNVSTPLIWWNAGDVVEFTYDGTQWLMQPTMQMLFSGQGTKIPREQIYSTSEKIVGCWTDGRPVYQKTISITTPTVSTDGTVAESIYSVGATVKQFISMVGYFTGSSNNAQMMFPRVPPNKNVGIWLLGCPNDYSTSAAQKNSIKIQSAYTGFNNGSGHVIIQYTKTTDAANSFNYGDPNDYSTTEKIVGTWIDGKLLYQKTIESTLPNCTTDGTEVSKLVSIGVTAKLITGLNLITVRSTGTEIATGSYYVLDSNGGYIRVSANNSSASSNPNIVGLTLNKASWANSPCYITVQYTKS